MAQEQCPERAVFSVFESMIALIHSDIGMLMIGREFRAKVRSEISIIPVLVSMREFACPSVRSSAVESVRSL